MIDLRSGAGAFCGAFCDWGLATNLAGATTLKGLFAAGESAALGLHGANRLANNSLLEGLVFGKRAAPGMVARIGPANQFPSPGSGAVPSSGLQTDLR